MEAYDRAKIKSDCLQMARDMLGQEAGAADKVLSLAERLWGFVSEEGSGNTGPGTGTITITLPPVDCRNAEAA